MIQEFPTWLPSVIAIPATPVQCVNSGREQRLFNYWEKYFEIQNYFGLYLFYTFYFHLKRRKHIRGQTVRIENYILTGLGFFREFSYKIKSQALEQVYIKHIQKRINKLTHFFKKAILLDSVSLQAMLILCVD